jgi:ABC-type transport system involved in multi-copper enzyme maturation permease subunit
MIGSSASRAIARLEWSELRRSRWLTFCAGLYALLASLLVAVGFRESDIVGFTGMSRVLASLSHALVILVPLLALAGTALSVNRARDSGALEVLLSQPVSRDAYFAAVTVVRTAALVAPIVLLLPAIAIAARLGLDQSVPWLFLGETLAVSASLTWAFTGIGLAISTGVRESSRALVYALAVWAGGVTLLDFVLIGAMLQWRVPPEAVFAVAAANPVETARLALLAGADPSLATLGPVGVFFAERLGQGWLFVSGAAWPAVVGTSAWLFARRRFRRGEVV